MKPKAWSFTALDRFVNCPRQYHEVTVLKSVVDAGGTEMAWGNMVHKAFEDRQRDGVVLPIDLQHHEPYMEKLQTLPGTLMVESRIALNRKLQPCSGRDWDNVWVRMVVDFGKVDAETAVIVDYKTGKPHSKFKQLKLSALWVFAKYPKVEQVSADFYWTTTMGTTGEVYRRDQIADLWLEFVPDLKQYAEAFRTNTWQPRPSGLCKGWCPVTSCEHWSPKRS